MTNLITKVAELRELAGRRQAIIYRQKESVNHALLERLEIESDLLNATPELLAVLGKVQAGDADEIDYAIQDLTRIFGPDNVAETIEVLHRHADLARTMEGNP